MLPMVAPELSEWAAFYADSGRRQGAIEAGVLTVTCREADDMVRQSECFLEVVRGVLHLPVVEPVGNELVAMSVR